MRLTSTEKKAIVETIRAHDPRARIILYGSRVDDSLKGGDIDLVVLSEKIGFKDKVTILVEIKARLGEQKIDLFISSSQSTDPFFQEAIRKGVALE